MDKLPLVLIACFFLLFLGLYLVEGIVTKSTHRNTSSQYNSVSVTEESFNSNLIEPNKLQVYQGNMLPITPSDIQLDTNNPSAPSIDGVSKDTSMFMMAFNKCDPSCCPSPYSCDRGCVCMTKDQINYVGTRGFNNRSSKCTGVSEI